MAPNGAYAAVLSATGTIDPANRLPTSEAALCRRRVTHLGTFGGPFSDANDVNDSGQVVSLAGKCGDGGE